MRHGLVGRHALHDAARIAHDLDGFACVVVRHVDGGFLDRLQLVAVLVGLVDHLRTPDLEFEAFATHGLHQNRQVQHATACHLDACAIFGLFDAHGDVALLFAHQALFELAAAHDLSVTPD